MRKSTTALFLFLFCLLSGGSPVAAQEVPPPAQETPAESQEGAKLPKDFEEELKRAEEEGGSRFFEEFVNMLFTLGAIIVFVMLFMWILKRMLTIRVDQVNKTSAIKILERRTLTPKTSIYVLGILGKAVAIADSTNGVTLLTELSGGEKKEEYGSSPTAGNEAE